MITGLFRDKSRDQLTKVLNGLGIDATMVERNREEESVKRKGDSLGLIAIDRGPVGWVNVVREIETPSSVSYKTYWYVFGIPSRKPISPELNVALLATRGRRGSLLNSENVAEWEGNAADLITSLSRSSEIESFCIRQGELRIWLHQEAFQGWAVEIKKSPLSRRDYEAIEDISRALLSWDFEEGS